MDLLKGYILCSLTLLALPIMGSQLVQMAYNLTDMIWIGRVGAGAVAAVGAAGMFMWLSNGMAVLPRMGGQVKVAQSIGAGDIEAAGRYAAAALQMGGVMSLVYTVAMFVGAGPLIGFFRLNSAEVEAQARAYLIIVGFGMFFSFINQVLVALINATGNSRTPFFAMAVGLGANIVLDPVLIFGVGPFPKWGVAGAAVATVTAQGIVFALLARYAVQDQTLFAHVHLKRPAARSELAAISKVSGPATAMNIIFPLIGMVIARLVAGWGDAAVAVQKVGSQIESIPAWMTADGFAAAVNSFIAQKTRRRGQPAPGASGFRRGVPAHDHLGHSLHRPAGVLRRAHLPVLHPGSGRAAHGRGLSGHPGLFRAVHVLGDLGGRCLRGLWKHHALQRGEHRVHRPAHPRGHRPQCHGPGPFRRVVEHLHLQHLQGRHPHRHLPGLPCAADQKTADLRPMKEAPGHAARGFCARKIICNSARCRPRGICR